MAYFSTSPLSARARWVGGRGRNEAAQGMLIQCAAAVACMLGSEQALAPVLALQRTFGEGACFKVSQVPSTSRSSPPSLPSAPLSHVERYVVQLLPYIQEFFRAQNT